MRIEQLNRENYDTWKIQMQAILVKNEAWEFVNGQRPKPEIIDDNARSQEEVRRWKAEDEKAKADIILSIKPSELKQIKGCNTSRELWTKLQAIYQSTGPARKSTLIKQLTYHRIHEGEDVREHMLSFFDTIDKLSEMDILINPDLLSVMLQHSLPASFANFRCAIESRDQLPSPETLRIKILEENDARKSDEKENDSTAMYANKHSNRKKFAGKKSDSGRKVENSSSQKKEPFKYKCHRCRKVGHKASDCTEKIKNSEDVNAAEDLCLCASAIERPEHQEATFKSEELRSRRSWCIDSGCTSHMCSEDNYSTKINSQTTGKVHLASNTYAEIKGKGPITFTAEHGGRETCINLTEALYVPDLRTNLLSVGKICDKGLRVIFEKKKATVVDRNGSSVLSANRASNGLYCLETRTPESSANAEWNEEKNSKSRSTLMWHRRMGHLNFKDLIKCAKEGTVKGLEINENFGGYNCETCAKGKMSRKALPKRSQRQTDLLDIVHTDICGPMQMESIGQSRYFITFIDDSSRWCEVRFLRKKSDTFQAFKEYKAMVENLTGKRIKCLQSDNGKEYVNSAFEAFLKENGIRRRLSIPYTPEQNGVAGRKNRTLVEAARCLLLESSLPKFLWAEAINTANHIRNRCPSSSLEGRSAYEKWTGKVPDVSTFETFGHQVMVKNPEPHASKWDAKSRKGIFVGYSEVSKGFRIFFPDKRKIEITRDIRAVDEAPRDMSSRAKHDEDSKSMENDEETIEFQVEATEPAVNEPLPTTFSTRQVKDLKPKQNPMKEEKLPDAVEADHASNAPVAGEDRESSTMTPISRMQLRKWRI